MWRQSLSFASISSSFIYCSGSTHSAFYMRIYLSIESNQVTMFAYHIFGHSLPSWLRQHNPPSWLVCTTMIFIMYRIFFCMFAIHDIHHGCICCRDHICAKMITTIPYRRKLPRLCCVYYICYASVACSLAQSSAIHVADSLATIGCSIFIIQSLIPSPVSSIQDPMVPRNWWTVTTVLPFMADTMVRELPKDVTDALCFSWLGIFISPLCHFIYHQAANVGVKMKITNQLYILLCL